ncbi:MAG: hypothetical protein WDN69_34150 [Aliidongia sp.]
MAPASSAMSSPAPSARLIWTRWSSGRKPSGSSRLSFSVPQTDRKLVVN